MRPDDIKAHQKRRPFCAIRIHASDGSSYEVRHPEMMLVTRSEVIIGLENGNGDVPQRSVYCDPIHITRIEPLDGKKRKRSAKPRR